MTLPARPMHVPAGLAIDEATRPELLDAGAANLSNVNVRQEEPGSLSKRLGFAALGKTRLNATARTAGNRLCVHKDTLCTIDGTYLDTYAEPLATSVTTSVRMPEASVTARTSVAAGMTALTDFAICNGYVAYTTLPPASAYGAMVIVETTDGVVIPSAELPINIASTPTNSLIGTYSTYFVVLTADGLGNVEAYYLNVASAVTIALGWTRLGPSGAAAWASFVPLATDLSGVQLAKTSLTDRIAFAYVNTSAGTSRLTVKTLSIAGVLETATVNTSSVTPAYVGLAGSIADTLWVAWNEAADFKVQGRDADALATTLASTATIFSATTGAILAPPFIQTTTTGAGILSGNWGTATDVQWSFRAFSTSGGATTPSATAVQVLGGVFQASRSVALNGRYYAVFHGGDDTANTQGGAFFCDLTEIATKPWLRPVASFAAYLSKGSLYQAVLPVATSATTVALATGVKRNDSIVVAEYVTLDFADRKRWQSVTHNGSTFFSGGILSYFDGRRVAEAGFLYSPGKLTTSVSNGSLTTTLGGYRYVAVWEELDSDGNWCISGVSLPSAITGNFTAKIVNVTGPALAISARYSAQIDQRVRGSIFRTTDGGNPPYYLVTALGALSPTSILNVADSTTDETLSANRQLYAPNLPGVNGSAQDRRAPPFCQALASYNGMLVIASGADLWWSGQTIAGEGTWFNPAFQVPVEGAGNVTALAAQDGTLYAFKRRAIFAVAGEAPSDNGASGGLGTPRRLAVDVGCIDPHSVVVTSAGIFFQSERGIELLTRSGAVMWIGEKVQDTLAAYPIVGRAVLDDRNGLVRFSLAAGESGGRVSGEGRDLVFDLTLGAWVSVDDKRGASVHEASQDAGMFYLGGLWRYGWLATDGTVYYERAANDASAHLDGSTWVRAEYELPPLKFGLQQDMRSFEWMILFERHSAAGLTIEVANDFGDYGNDTADKVWAEAATSGQQQLPFRVKHNGQAVQLRVRDTAPAILGTGKGFTFIGISADVAPKQGPTRGTPRLATSLRR